MKKVLNHDNNSQGQVTPKMTPTQKKGPSTSNHTNKKIIKNAILMCLAGETNKLEREDVLKVIDSTEFNYYIILFRGNLGRQDFKALYSHDGNGSI
jgi:hypothetical protein